MNIKSYDLSFDINFQELVFTCREIIRIEHANRSVSLDCLGLHIRKVGVDGIDRTFRFDEKTAMLTVADLTENAEVRVVIDYDGKVSADSLHGFYKSKYQSGYLLSTDLEPQGARKLFPCIDSPSFKAEFNVEVTTDKDLVVIANTPLLRTEEIPGIATQRKFIFETTPKMSTYLFYLGVGRFDQVSKKDKNVEFIVAASPGQARRGLFSLDNSMRFLRALEQYYSIPYPLPKIHLIPLPEYASGAMENWGAITFREVAFFVDENTSIANKRRATMILAHELAHQWFGNLVTMKWWNDLWLNESFATFVESKMTEKLYPEWNILADFIKGETAWAMHSDSLTSTHPIDVKVNSPDEVAQIFDQISYGKGASVIRMIEAFVGEEEFRQGVANYLKQYSYGNAEGKNLWQNIERTSKRPVSKMMEAWITRPGYPVVEVESKDNKLLVLKQKRFLLLNDGKEEVNPWPIPLSMSLNGDSMKFVFEGEKMEIPLDSKIRHLKVNVEQAGFYRVLYDENLYDLIGLEFASLSPLDKWGIVFDLFAFLLTGLTQLDKYLSFVRKCYEENDYLVVDSVTDQLHLLRLIAPANRLIREAYSSFLLFHGKRLGLVQKSGEKETDNVLRGKTFAGLAMIDDPSYSVVLAEKFDIYDSVDPNIRSAVAIAYARRNELSAFGPMVETMKRIGSEADIIKISSGLVSSKNPELVRMTLDLSVSGEINRADSVNAIESAAGNPDAGNLTWEWTTKNLSKLREIFTGTYIVSTILEEVIPFAGLGREEEVKKYISKENLEDASEGVKKGLELLEIYSRVRNRLSVS